MERREFLRFAAGIAAGAGAIAAAASAASAAPMLAPQNGLTPRKEPDMAAEPAVADQDEVARLAPEQVAMAPSSLSPPLLAPPPLVSSAR